MLGDLEASKLCPRAFEILAVMFNEDGDMWVGSSDSRKIVYAVAPMYPRERIAELIVELDGLVAGRYSDDELKAFTDRIGVRMGFEQLTVKEWLTTVRSHLREFVTK